MLLSDTIAKWIEQMLQEEGGSLEIQRNDLAGKLGCVPSQINYVITSRFTPERGYLIESRRGGGGYIRIVKKQMQRDEFLMHFFNAIGNSLSEAEALAFLRNLFGNRLISEREKAIMQNALSANSLQQVPAELRNSVRADILRHIILTLME